MQIKFGTVILHYRTNHHQEYKFRLFFCEIQKATSTILHHMKHFIENTFLWYIDYLELLGENVLYQYTVKMANRKNHNDYKFLLMHIL